MKLAVFVTAVCLAVPSMSFKGTIRQQIYGGATDLLEVDCGGDQLVRVRISAREPLSGEHEFVFSGKDAIRVQE